MLLILGGLFKKMVIANYISVRFVDPVFTDPAQFSRFDLIVAVYAYAIQIYADFSAYTDIAIGVAALLGYRFPQNFNQPYRALGIGDFWRRWHMTLSRWLRDYLYIPLGGNRHGALATARNLMVTMLLGGLWHGADWTFLIWGAMHGVALVADHAWRRSAAFARFGGGPIARVVDWALTFHFVCFAWLFFRSPSLDAALQFLAGVWTDNGAPSTMPMIVLPLIACGALTQIVPSRTRVAIGAVLDNRGPAIQVAFGFALLYFIVVMAPSASRRSSISNFEESAGDRSSAKTCLVDQPVELGAGHLFRVRAGRLLLSRRPRRLARRTQRQRLAHGAAGDRAGDRRGFGRGRREGRGAGAAQMVRAGGGEVGYLKERAGRRLGRPRFSLLLGYPFPNTSLFMIFLECFYSVSARILTGRSALPHNLLQGGSMRAARWRGSAQSGGSRR